VVTKTSLAVPCAADGGGITFSTSLEEGGIVLQVRDTGAGIPATVKGRMFDVSCTTKGEGKGTGLGLVGVQRIVTAHGGSVACESETGEGAIFRVRLSVDGGGPAEA